MAQRPQQQDQLQDDVARHKKYFENFHFVGNFDQGKDSIFHVLLGQKNVLIGIK